MSAKEWPPQNTGLFAPPMCVVCCTESVVDSVEFAFSNVTFYTMVGIAGFDGTAGVLYRTMSWSGSITTSYSNDGDCGTTERTNVASYSGSTSVGLDGNISGECQISEGGTLTVQQNFSNPYLVAPQTGGGNLTSTDSDTTQTLTGDGSCMPSGGDFNNAKATGTATAVLSNICSETAAIGYAESAAPGWKEFESSSVSSPDWTYASTWWPSSNYAAQYPYARTKFRRMKGGFIPGRSYNVSMQVLRGPYGATSGDLYATISGTLTADGFGVLTWEAETPFARGYSTMIDPSTFTATPA